MARQHPDEEDQAEREVTSGVLVRMKHIRAAKICRKGARTWFDHHGISWSELLERGIPVEVLEATGDKPALDVAAIARGEHG